MLVFIVLTLILVFSPSVVYFFCFVLFIRTWQSWWLVRQKLQFFFLGSQSYTLLSVVFILKKYFQIYVGVCGFHLCAELDSLILKYLEFYLQFKPGINFAVCSFIFFFSFWLIFVIHTLFFCSICWYDEFVHIYLDIVLPLVSLFYNFVVFRFYLGTCCRCRSWWCRSRLPASGSWWNRCPRACDDRLSSLISAFRCSALWISRPETSAA